VDGADGGNGTWTCSGDACSGHVMFGPYVALPPGSYVAGFMNVSASDVTALLDVTSDRGATTITSQNVDAYGLSGAAVAMPFTLTGLASDVEVRMDLSGSATSSVTIGGVFIRRM